MADDDKPFKVLVDKICEDAEQLAEAAQQFTRKLTTTSSTAVQDAVGKTAEVSVAIPVGGIGEIIVSLGSGLQNFPAKCVDGKRAFKRGDQLRIERANNHQMFVKAVE